MLARVYLKAITKHNIQVNYEYAQSHMIEYPDRCIFITCIKQEQNIRKGPWATISAVPVVFAKPLC